MWPINHPGNLRHHRTCSRERKQLPLGSCDLSNHGKVFFKHRYPFTDGVFLLIVSNAAGIFLASSFISRVGGFLQKETAVFLAEGAVGRDGGRRSSPRGRRTPSDLLWVLWPGRTCVLLCTSGHNKGAQPGGPTQQTFTVSHPGDWNPRTRCRQGLFLPRPLLACRCRLLFLFFPSFIIIIIIIEV